MRFTLPEIQRLRRKSYANGMGTFLFDAACYLLAISGTMAAPYLRQRILCGILAGIWTSKLLIIAHDACHQSLTPNRILNRLVGTLAFLPALHSYSLWQYGHNHLHHLFTNVRGLDSVWEPLTLREYQQLSWGARCLYRFFRTPFGHFFYYLYEMWWKRRLVPYRKYVGHMESQYWYDFAVICGWLLTLSATAIVARAGITGSALADPATWIQPLCLTIVIPFLVGEMLLSSSEFLQHTHPMTQWYAHPASGSEWTDRQARSAVHVRFPAVMDWLVHWIMDHTAHHMQPAIPLYHLSEAQQIVEQRRETDVVTYRWSVRAQLRILSACKLYDPQRGCWTDYDGRPTSEPRQPVDSGSIDMAPQRTVNGPDAAAA